MFDRNTQVCTSRVLESSHLWQKSSSFMFSIPIIYIYIWLTAEMIFVNMDTRCLPNSSQVQTKYEKRILSPILGTSIYLLTNYLFICLIIYLFIRFWVAQLEAWDGSTYVEQPFRNVSKYYLWYRYNYYVNTSMLFI